MNPGRWTHRISWQQLQQSAALRIPVHAQHGAQLGTVRVHWKKGALDLERWVEQVEAFGYQFGPARKEGSRKSIDLPARLGISAAIAINVMLVAHLLRRPWLSGAVH